MDSHRRTPYLTLCLLLSIVGTSEAHAAPTASPIGTSQKSSPDFLATRGVRSAELQLAPARLRELSRLMTPNQYGASSGEPEPSAPPAAPKTSAPPKPAPPPNAGQAPTVEAKSGESEAGSPAPEESAAGDSKGPEEVDAEPSATEPEAAEQPADAAEAPTEAAVEASAADTQSGDEDAATEADDSQPLLDPFAAVENESEADKSTAGGDTDKGMAPKHSIFYSNLLVARLNPLGLANRLSLEYRYRLYDTRSVLKDGSYIAVGFEPFVTPAVARISGVVFVKPLAILRLRASYGLFAQYGTFQFTQSYDTPTAEHFTAEYYATDDERYATIGSQGQFGALLQAKIGPIAIRNDTNFFRTDIDLKDNNGLFGKDDLFYYIQDDIMLAAHGWHVTNDSDVLYLSDFGLTAGIRTSVTKAFYPDDIFLPGESTNDPNGPTVRVGPLIAYTFYDKPEEKKRFNKPSILLISQWWVKHRYRTGAAADFGQSISDRPDGKKEPVGNLGDSLPAMPWFVLGFAFQGELFASD